jgi:hypothetical protein
MARYQKPPDPRSPEFEEWQSKNRQQRKKQRQPVPWLWLGLGVLVTAIGLILAAVFISFFLFRDPLTVSLPTPTIIRLTAPPTTQASPTAFGLNTTPIPTFTPPPTPDLSVAPEAITVGYFTRVANTDGIGVSLRGGPSTDNIRLSLIPEGDYLLITGGPEEGSGFVWWQVQAADDTEGWVAGDFLVPAAAPPQGEE